MIKNISQFEVKVGEKIFQLLCHPESTWAEVHDAIYNIKDFVIQQMSARHDMEKNQPEQFKCAANDVPINVCPGSCHQEQSTLPVTDECKEPPTKAC